jgi:Calpain family cysteine protease
LTDAGVQTDVQAAVAAGGFTYSNMLTLLQDVAKSVTAAGTSTTPGALTASQLSSLQAVAAHLNNGVSCDDYLASIFQQCVDGSPMNADWTGGSATATALGNLAIGSSATQINELIGKWFLGTDLPEPGAASYQNYTAPLFGPTGGPSTSDVMQGETGDCEFLSGLNDLATNDPSAAKSMIVSDGDGVYGVRFYINGVETWVTVNSELPTSGVYGGLLYNDLQATNPTRPLGESRREGLCSIVVKRPDRSSRRQFLRQHRR